MKISVARIFPNLGRNIFFLGAGVYLLAFTLVLITAGYYVEKMLTDKAYVYQGPLCNDKSGKCPARFSW
jgi:hypothetical protein